MMILITGMIVVVSFVVSMSPCFMILAALMQDIYPVMVVDVILAMVMMPRILIVTVFLQEGLVLTGAWKQLMIVMVENMAVQMW